MKVSIVIPALNESGLIRQTIKSCQAANADEIIVCDGGSQDDTQQVAIEMDCVLIKSLAGRGRQLSQGAKQATGDILLFLHADSLLTSDCLKQIREYVAESESGADSRSKARDYWGCFQQRVGASGFLYRWLERGNRWRASSRRLVYGDQAMWINRELYLRVGGFPEVPLMEDVMISDELRKILQPVVLPGPVTIPSRHWERKGVILTTLRNWYLMRLFRFGYSPEQIADRYRSV